MSINLNPQEIYLLERYISPQYFARLHAIWSDMVSHVEACLASYMSRAPADLRSRALPEQPDVVWGGKVIPNFQRTLQGLEKGLNKLLNGDVQGLSYAWGPRNDFKGQMDFWSGWMSTEDENKYGDFLNSAVTLASNICATESAYWEPFDLATYSEHWGPLNRPQQWPSYRINEDISVQTGQPMQRSGIYVPDVDASCAQFLSISGEVAPSAKVLIGIEDIPDPETGEKYDEERIFEERDCTWYLVERVDSASRELRDAVVSDQTQRVRSGQACPETGYYFTPAQAGSRKLFEKGTIMPAFETGYGTTVWQWDINQK